MRARWRLPIGVVTALELAACHREHARPPSGGAALAGDSGAAREVRSKGDPAVTQDPSDCVCKDAVCEHPCAMIRGELGIDVSDPELCGMAAPCWVSAKRLAEARAAASRAPRRLAHVEPVPPSCVVAATPPRLAPYEVTVWQYRSCTVARACTPPAAGFSMPAREWSPQVHAAMRDERRAVTGVTREQAAAYCAWVGSRLPTAEEWVRAARADCHKFPWGDEPDVRSSNCLHNESARVIARPGAFPRDVVRGVYDLHANVAEWTSDGPPLGVPYCNAVLGTVAESTAGDESTGFRCMAIDP